MTIRSIVFNSKTWDNDNLLWSGNVTVKQGGDDEGNGVREDSVDFASLSVPEGQAVSEHDLAKAAFDNAGIPFEE